MSFFFMSQNVQETSRKVRLRRRRELYKQRVARETTEQKEARLAKMRERYAARRAELRLMESDDQREERLSRRREVYAAQSDDHPQRLARRREVYAALSDDQKEERLARRREVYATQSNHQREERLQRTQQIHDSRLIKFHDSQNLITKKNRRKHIVKEW